jgi:hypothetical protein
VSVDLAAAASFLATHGRILDRRRFEDEPAAILAAVDAYRNADGGYGWGMEPDLRSPESQPGGALHAFEAMAEAAPLTTPHAVALCDWLLDVTLPDGGLPFALPVGGEAGVAPFWAAWDPSRSSLQITAYVAEAALRVARFDDAVAAHPWLERASSFCLAAIDALDEAPHALVLVAAARFADAVGDAARALERLGALIPRDGTLHVAGGAEDEMVRPLDFAPFPDRPARALLDPDAVRADLDRLAAGQQDDGGWRVDYASYSPAAALEWRGYATVRAVAVLRANGVV